MRARGPAARIAHRRDHRLRLRWPPAVEPVDQPVDRLVFGEPGEKDDGHLGQARGYPRVGDADDTLGLHSGRGTLRPGQIGLRHDRDDLGWRPGLSGSGELLAGQPGRDSRACQDGGDPLGPQQVLRAEVEDDLGRSRQRPGKLPPGAQPQPFLPRRQRGDGVIGDPGRDPLVRGQQRTRGAGPVTECRERLLVRVRRSVRHLHLGPVLTALRLRHPRRQLFELALCEPQTVEDFVLPRVVDAHGHGQDRDVAVGIPLNLPGYLGRALDALGAQREAVDDHIRQVQRAYVRDIGQARPAVDQNVVVGAFQISAQCVEELAAVQVVVEVVPLQGAQRLHVHAVVLFAGSQEINAAGVGKPPAHRHCVLAHVGNVLGDKRGDRVTGRR